MSRHNRERRANRSRQQPPATVSCPVCGHEHLLADAVAIEAHMRAEAVKVRGSTIISHMCRNCGQLNHLRGKKYVAYTDAETFHAFAMVPELLEECDRVRRTGTNELVFGSQGFTEGKL